MEEQRKQDNRSCNKSNFKASNELETAQDSKQYHFPSGKRYNSFAGFFRREYGERLQKLVIDAGFCCPNRDGKVGVGGCTYCNNDAFHPNYSTPDKDIFTQLEEGIEFHKVRYRNAKHYLAYFQAYSNTYAPLPILKKLYEKALSHPDVVGIVIGTRPDCVDEEKLDYIASLKNHPKHPVVIMEYGIESCFDESLDRMNRGHDFECARRAVEMTKARGLQVGAHFILGLPGETRDMMLKQCDVINSLPIDSIKFHQLQIIKGTAMEKEFEACPEDFVRMELDEYIDFIIDILERLRPDLYIERIAGEVPPRFVSKAQWGLVRNCSILTMLDRRLEERKTWQSRLYAKI